MDRLWAPSFSVDSSECVSRLTPREAFREKDGTFYPGTIPENPPAWPPSGVRVGLSLRRPRPSPSTHRWREGGSAPTEAGWGAEPLPRRPDSRLGAPLDFSPTRSSEPCTQLGWCGWTFWERGPAVPSRSCGPWSEPTQTAGDTARLGFGLLVSRMDMVTFP